MKSITPYFHTSHSLAQYSLTCAENWSKTPFIQVILLIPGYSWSSVAFPIHSLIPWSPYLCPQVCDRPYDRRGAGLGWRGDTRSADLWGVCHAAQHPARWRGRPGRDALPAPAAAEGGTRLQHNCRARDRQDHQRGGWLMKRSVDLSTGQWKVCDLERVCWEKVMPCCILHPLCFFWSKICLNQKICHVRTIKDVRGEKGRGMSMLHGVWEVLWLYVLYTMYSCHMMQ